MIQMQSTQKETNLTMSHSGLKIENGHARSRDDGWKGQRKQAGKKGGGPL